MSIRRTLLAILFAVSAALPAAAQEKLPVVATFSILGDFVKNVGGDRVAVTTLVGPNGDTHVYQPSPADAKKLAAAKVIFVNGFKLEGWMDRLIKASGTKASVIVTVKGITPREMAEADEHAHERGVDPHAWQSIANARIYVANIRDALITADPDGKSAYEKNTDDYLAKLAMVETEVKEGIAKIPPERRRIITTHDAFGYFGAAYGFEFIAPQGVSTETEASAQDVAKIIRQIRAQKIPAVFLENVSDPRLVQRIADETGAKIGGTLYSDALSAEDGPASTYVDMMRHNIRELSAALTS
ncbi:MAG TPA: metal ABC transporter substrate-binding protein [Xanthobacteraceae bacterium]|nr:metal ABC transporter substrate-binding protein [Xanthobacteraceae bacterium]